MYLVGEISSGDFDTEKDPADFSEIESPLKIFREKIFRSVFVKSIAFDDLIESENFLGLSFL